MPQIDRNISHLAGEFLVAGELARRGYPVSLTLGNAKSVDIHAETSKGKGMVRVQVKAQRRKSNWTIREDSIEDDIFYIFVFLQTVEAANKNETPEYFVARGEELKELVMNWRIRPGIPYACLNKEQFKEKWDKLPAP